MTRPILSALAAAALLLPAAAAAPAIPECFSADARARLADYKEVEPTENALNVVYFIGSDREPVADHERRISELLIYLQQYYAGEMERNGFGRRAFGLIRKPDGMVDILLIRGREKGEVYGYSNGGVGKCIAEVEAYFKANPEKNNSRHTFVIMPTFYDDKHHDEAPGGVPFYGYGKWCFALDYAHFDIKYLGQDNLRGKLMTKWYGGFAHELGHGLNMPHNEATATDKAALGTPLMGAGNYTFGLKPTYLTKASCAILDRSQTFARKGDKTDFYAPAQDAPQVSDAKLLYRDDTLYLKFRMSGSCEHVNVYMQDPPYSVNRDYDAIAFTATIDPADTEGKRTVYVEIPRSEIAAHKHDEKQIGVYFLQKDGNRFRWNTEFKWSEVQPGSEIPLNPEQPKPAGY